MKHKLRWSTAKGFALPTVMIASIVMLIVLLSGLVSTSSINTSLRQQYYTRLNNEAFAAGYTRAQSCLNAFGSATWSNGSPLRPDSSCAGGTQCTSGPTCYVLSTNNLKTTFTVNGATLNSDGSYTIPITSEVQLFRTSLPTSPSQSLPNTGYARAVPLYWRAISAGTRFTCGLTLSTNPTYDNKVKCWGSNNLYYLGNKTSSASLVPTDVATDGVLKGLSIKKIEAGSSSTCAIASDDNAYCWGHNQQYALGDNTSTVRTSPVAVYRNGALSGKTVKDIAVAANSAQCLLASDNKAYCWGENSFGAVGDNTTTPRAAPVAVYSAGVLNGKNLTAIYAGHNTVCATDTAGIGYCWGGTYLGNGSSSGSLVPVQMTMNGALSGKTITQMSLGNSFGCVLASDAKVYCWGNNSRGVLGNGTINNTTYVPGAVSNMASLTITSISAGNTWVCALATNNRIYCWGHIGELSGSYVTDSTVPVAIDNTGVLAGKTIASITSGYEQICALDTEGKKYCFGGNAEGAFGNGGSTGSINPVTTFNTWLTLQY